MKAKYIHYGHKEFDEHKFIEPVNITLRNKPFGGLWNSGASRKREWNDIYDRRRIKCQGMK